MYALIVNGMPPTTLDTGLCITLTLMIALTVYETIQIAIPFTAEMCDFSVSSWVDNFGKSFWGYLLKGIIIAAFAAYLIYAWKYSDMGILLGLFHVAFIFVGMRTIFLAISVIFTLLWKCAICPISRFVSWFQTRCR